MRSESECREAFAVEGAEHAGDNAVRISVIIPVLNEEARIGKCLESLVRCDFPRNAFEVVVVDNGSTDRTLEIAGSYVQQLRVRTLQQAGVTISALRNLGVAASRGGILAFLDADCLVLPNWLQHAATRMSPENSEIVGGGYIIPEDSRWVARAWFEGGYAPKSGEVAYVPAGNMLMRRSVFTRLNGFNEAVETSEDWELCSRARTEGLTVRAVPEMAVVHLGTPQALRQFFRKQHWHGTHALKVLLRDLRALANLRAVVFGLYMAGAYLAVIAGVVLAALFARYVPLYLASAALLAAPIACSFAKLRKAEGKNRWKTFLPLTVLHFVYGTARATAFVSPYHRGKAQFASAASTEPAHTRAGTTV